MKKIILVMLLVCCTSAVTNAPLINTFSEGYEITHYGDCGFRGGYCYDNNPPPAAAFSIQND